MSAVTSDFNANKYINLETFRKRGVGVPTPVWFVQSGAQIYVRTYADSGKVKRLRYNERARIAPCTQTGETTGEWREARARVLDDPQTTERVERLLRQKYGFLKSMFDFVARIRKTQMATILIETE